MTQIEKIIQGLTIIQKYNPDAQVESTNKHIITSATGVTDEDLSRLEHIGWIHVTGAFDDLFGFITRK